MKKRALMISFNPAFKGPNDLHSTSGMLDLSNMTGSLLISNDKHAAVNTGCFWDALSYTFGMTVCDTVVTFQPTGNFSKQRSLSRQWSRAAVVKGNLPPFFFACCNC